jgi:hypothetical protein
MNFLHSSILQWRRRTQSLPLHRIILAMSVRHPCITYFTLDRGLADHFGCLGPSAPGIQKALADAEFTIMSVF